LLKRDHHEVTRLFQRHATGGRRAHEVLTRLCDPLEVHSLIGEEIFYPAVREWDEELSSLVDEVLEEHARVKQDVAALRHRGFEDGVEVESMVFRLQEDVEHHVTEEEGRMFPLLAELMDSRRRAELGARLAERKSALTGGRKRTARGASARRRPPRGATQAGVQVGGRGAKRATAAGKVSPRRRQRGTKSTSTGRASVKRR
jgi:hypothetical protein